ncbi:MAG: LysM peptidoglycan-binding domain-containing protein, partial [Polyangiaceae bacterium]
MPAYTVKPGDYLVKIAAEHGTTWQAIWHHPANAQLRSSRSSADELYPGDVLFIEAGAPDGPKPAGPPPPEPVTPKPATGDPPPGLPWPYPPPASSPPEPTWDCPGGTCVCHPIDETEERVEHRIVFYNKHALRMPFARVRVFESGRLL